MRDIILEEIEDEIRCNAVFGDLMECTMLNFIAYNRRHISRLSGYIDVRNYDHLTMRHNYFNRYTSRIFAQLKNNNLNYRFYRTNTLSNSAFYLYNSLFTFASHYPSVDIERLRMDELHFDIRCCKCEKCGVLQKRGNVKINWDPTQISWICRQTCNPIRLDEIPPEISILDDVEKQSLRLIKLFGQFHGPNYRDYARYLGTASLSTNWNIWRDLSGFMGIGNSYNRFVFVNNNRVVNALHYLTRYNPLYNFELNDELFRTLSFMNENPTFYARANGAVFTTLRQNNQDLVGTEDAEPAVLPIGEEITTNVNQQNQTHIITNTQIPISISPTLQRQLSNVFSMTFQQKEGRIFPYLYPKGLFFNENNEDQRAKRIRDYLFLQDGRFRNCYDWIFYQYDKTETSKIFFNDNRVVRNQQVSANAGNVLTRSTYTNRLVFRDEATRKLPVTIRSSNTYFKKIRSDLLAYIATFGPPHLFLTLNCDELTYSNLHAYVHQHGTINPNNADNWHVGNPVLCNHYCYERLNAMILDITKHGYCGYSVIHYFKRYEFQMRGTVHAHVLLWLENPNDSNNDLDFNYLLNTISGQLPDIRVDPYLFYLVNRYQRHTHGDYCWPQDSRSCRFGFPKREIDSNFFDFVRNQYHLKRTEDDIFINAYNPEILKKWRSNMDIKLVTSELVARYITKYCTKEEPFSVIRDTRDEVERYLETRNFTVHEIAHLLSVQPVTSFDTKIIRIPCCSTLINHRQLLPLRRIRELNSNDTDIYYHNAIDLYINRFEEAEQLNIIEYFSRYEKLSFNAPFQYVDLINQKWKALNKQRVVRVYPFYREGNGDLYYYQLILCNSIYRNASTLIDEISDPRQYCLNHFPTLVTLNDRIQQVSGDIEISDDIPLPLTTELRLMYNLTSSTNDFLEISQLSQAQYSAYNTIINSSDRLFILQGGPGTGKSTLIKTIFHFGTQQGLEIALTATTGLASFLIGGYTIHSKLMLFNREDEWVTNIFRNNNIDTILGIDIIIVDEYSMLNSEILHKILEIQRSPRLNEPKIVLCGDINQLPPVSGEPVTSSPYYPHFHLLNLNTNHRAESSILINIINDFYSNDDFFRNNLILDFINNRITFTPKMHNVNTIIKIS
eukprot:NODE_448_length_7291_cov_0.696329.p1 type:complete len:1125 gc:universal NODE_448_length_7291_cov_0.696329:2757-6131(+)